MRQIAPSSLESLRHSNGAYAKTVSATRVASLVRGDILDQPEAVARVLAGRLDNRAALLAEAGLENGRLDKIDRIVVIGSGSSYNAGLLGCLAFEQWARIPARAERVADWGDRRPVLDPRTLVLGLAPPGDSHDTLAALCLARAEGAGTLAIVEGARSRLPAAPGPILRPGAGVERAPAATKTFTAQAALTQLLALALGEARGTLAAAEAARLAAALARLPAALASFLERAEAVDEIAEEYRGQAFFFFLGRQAGLPVCLEGALKLRELARIPAEASAAGEMKHGPIALIEEGTPVVTVVTAGQAHDKVVSNIEETRARGARVIAVASEGDEAVGRGADDVVFVPGGDAIVQGVVAVLPLQLLACRLARPVNGARSARTRGPERDGRRTAERVSQLGGSPAKRALDVVVSALLLVLLVPLVLLLAVAIKIDSRGSVLYRCRRVGRSGEEFDMLKFRKMRREAAGVALTAEDDDRFTRIGRVLARTKLDEFPQLWNVLKGEMSLVGPRPEDAGFVAAQEEAYSTILTVRPGITGLTQLAFAHESRILDHHDRVGHYLANLLPQKAQLDCLYVARRSLWMDLRILMWTAVAVLLRRDVAVHRGTGRLGLRAPRPRELAGSAPLNQPVVS